MNVKEKLKPREVQTLNRIISAKKSASVLHEFFDKGFRNYDALKAIVLNYFPELSERRLWDFWHLRIVDEDICDILIDVFEKLKAE